MALAEALAAAVFAATVAAIILRVVEESVAALAGLAAMILLTNYTPLDAFHFIDWNVMAVLLGMWLITGYLIEGGFAELVVYKVSSRIRSYRAFVLAMMIIAGFVSIFVDNVLVILLFGAVVLEAARRARGDPAAAILLVGFSANFMGTALLMGDLPPQLLHSVAGAEFLDFIWSHGRPSSFPLLTITFLAVSGAMYLLFLSKEPGGVEGEGSWAGEPARVDRATLLIGSLGFAATVVGMALRPRLGLPLGFITMAGAAFTALAAEAYRAVTGRGASFEKAAEHVEWRALLYYAALFGLVGGLQHTGVLEAAARRFLGFLEAGPLTAYTVFYWVVGALATVVEHDALLLTFLYLVRDAARMAGVNAWPLYWAMAWSATLASNMTMAAAPALYVAVAMAEKEGYHVPARKFFKYSVPYVLLSLVIQYAITAPIWAPLLHA